MINYADKMEQEARLKGNLAEWMEKHGTTNNFLEFSKTKMASISTAENPNNEKQKLF